MKPATLKLASHLIEPLKWVVETLDQWTGRDTYRMGGGSVLAARWGHRHSTYIDLFFDEFAQRDMPLSKMFDGLLSLESEGEIHGLEVYSGRGFLFQRKKCAGFLFRHSRNNTVTASEREGSHDRDRDRI